VLVTVIEVSGGVLGKYNSFLLVYYKWCFQIKDNEYRKVPIQLHVSMKILKSNEM